jgi:YD repeat-containing protein
VTTVTYDGLNRPVTAAVTVPWNAALNRSISYTYDALDRLTQAVDSLSGTITRSYNDVARTVTETAPQGSVTWAADKAGRTTSMTVAGQPVVTYTYDTADRLTAVTQNGACVSFTYDVANRRTSKTLPNGLVATYTYDEALLTGITYAQGATVLGTLTYGHDLLGRRTSVGGSWARTTLPSPVTAAYDAANQLSRFGTAPVSYDAAGQLTTDGTHMYEWDGRHQLTPIDGGAPGASPTTASGGARRRRSAARPPPISMPARTPCRSRPPLERRPRTC